MLEQPPLGLYIHIPWCIRKCPYCDFNSHVSDKKIDQEEFLELIEKEIDYHGKYIDNKKISSIFFASFTFILLYNPIVLSCQACRLKLAACGLLLVAPGFKPAPVLN